jgi:ubiquinone/menaquinone biosynthesis C-methylase UbiE
MKSVKKKLIDFWDTSSDYFLLARQKNIQLTDERDDMLKRIPKDSLVLDVACGTAENGKYISKIAKYLGIDISTLGLQMAKDYANPNFSLLRSDVDKLPFFDNSFDVIISTYSLEHFTDPEIVLNEIYRVCKKNGHIILISPSWDLPYSPPPSINEKLKNRFFRYRFDLFRFKEEILEILTDVFGIYRFNPLLIKSPEILERKFEMDNDTVYIVRIREIKRFFLYKGGKINYLRKSDRPFFPYYGVGLFIVFEKKEL